jgi:hypothetical protein
MSSWRTHAAAVTLVRVYSHFPDASGEHHCVCFYDVESIRGSMHMNGTILFHLSPYSHQHVSIFLDEKRFLNWAIHLMGLSSHQRYNQKTSKGTQHLRIVYNLIGRRIYLLEKVGMSLFLRTGTSTFWNYPGPTQNSFPTFEKRKEKRKCINDSLEKI